MFSPIFSFTINHRAVGPSSDWLKHAQRRRGANISLWIVHNAESDNPCASFETKVAVYPTLPLIEKLFQVKLISNANRPLNLVPLLNNIRVFERTTELSEFFRLITTQHRFKRFKFYTTQVTYDSEPSSMVKWILCRGIQRYQSRIWGRTGHHSTEIRVKTFCTAPRKR